MAFCVSTLKFQAFNADAVPLIYRSSFPNFVLSELLTRHYKVRKRLLSRGSYRKGLEFAKSLALNDFQKSLARELLRRRFFTGTDLAYLLPENGLY